MKLCTIGFSKRSTKDFFSILKETNIQKLIDIRRRNTSHLCGFAKKPDLKFFLEECFGIAYEHMPEFAPSEQLLTDYFKQIRNKEHAPTACQDYVQRFQMLSEHVWHMSFRRLEHRLIKCTLNRLYLLIEELFSFFKRIDGIRIARARLGTMVLARFNSKNMHAAACC